MNEGLISTVPIKVNILGIVLGGTESLLSIVLPNDFKFELINIKENCFSNKILSNDGTVNGEYSFCQLPPFTKNKINFVCITKYDSIQSPISAFSVKEIVGENHTFNQIIEEYQHPQDSFVRNLLTQLRLFKSGNIEIPSLFFNFKSTYGIQTITRGIEISHLDAGSVYDNFYTLSESEIQKLNNILFQNMRALSLLENVIDKFELGCKVIRDEIALKELVTVGEALFVGYNSDDGKIKKKEKFANRIATYIGKNNNEVCNIRNDLINSYKYRSDDTHKAKNACITASERTRLLSYIRMALHKYIDRISAEQAVNDRVSFNAIKRKIVLEIISDVLSYQNRGIIPTH